VNYLNGPLRDPAPPSPARGPAQVFLDHERISADWGGEYKILVSFSGDLWLFRPLGDETAPWAEAGSATEAYRAIEHDFTTRPPAPAEEFLVVSRRGKRWPR
jgi:hypothetical protein